MTTYEKASHRLERRIDELEKDGYDQHFLEVFRLMVQVSVALEESREGDPTTVFLELVAVQRRLLTRLAEVGALIRSLPIDRFIKKRILDSIGGLLSATKEIGRGRELLSVELSPAKSRETLEAEIKALLDRKYAKIAAALEAGEKEATDGQLPADR